MCGSVGTAAEGSCRECGELPQRLTAVDTSRDRVIGIGLGILSALICGYWIFSALPLLGVPRTVAEEITVYVSGVITALLWGPPILVTAMFTLSMSNKHQLRYRWRIFWQTQAIMYALSIGSVLLCSGVCTVSGR